MLATLLTSLQSPTFEGEERLVALTTNLEHRQPIGNLMADLGIRLIGTPYVGWTLERDLEREFCFVSLKGLDCVTFFENVLGIARVLKQERPITAANLLAEVTRTRYRGGQVDGYLSRLHYTSDWMDDNVAKGTVQWVGPGIPGAQRTHINFRFMSENAKHYRQLVHNPTLVTSLKDIEARLSQRERWYFPKSGVRQAEAFLKTGDIVGITTTMPGMDCSHTGLIVMRQGRARFLHASSTRKRVTFDVPITDYLAKSDKNTGILVVRPLEPAR